jgi:putative lipase involved disintegration of autophagic bodies
MRDPSLALQKALVGALTGQTAAGANVFDSVPSTDPFPRITVGEGTALGDYADCYDGSETILDVHVWSRQVGFPQAKTIAGQVRDILHDANLILDGHTLGLIEYQGSQNLRDPDGLTSHIAMTFRALTQPST